MEGKKHQKEKQKYKSLAEKAFTHRYPDKVSTLPSKWIICYYNL